MRYCPKCETAYEDDDEVCEPCGLELVTALRRREKIDDLEEDYAQGLFAGDDDPIRFCPLCLREFTPTSRICGDCGGAALTILPRRLFEAGLARSRALIFKLGEAEGVEAPSELERVLEAPSPGHAAFAAMSLEGMGVDAYVGDDAMEPDPGRPGVGIFVPKDEVEACAMIIPEDLDEWFEDEEDEAPSARGPYERKLALAEGYRRIGRYQYATNLVAEAIEMEPEQPAAFALLGTISAERGRHEKAAECFEEALKREKEPMASASMWNFIGQSLLDEEGRPRLRGPAADRALEALEAYCRGRPRFLSAWLLLLELHDARDQKGRAAEVVAAIRKVNRWILELEGPARACVERWKL